ncbi:putative oxidoreductase [Corynebacterium capitovis DSM 44611]|uniref:aldo/keto reductase n=1 Tax=Corynebacterium capitovis TaxID=131081 RepID=UPI00036E7F0B|nr:aldo/keto reductase [Corynebacterium capitovis]WKD58068.1 putative oxidoreductase [Corynebacterium capitovis DSM 44611]
MRAATLNDGTALPLLGLGTYKLRGGEAETIVRRAIEIGYRHIDTASFYGNEEEVGRAINAAMAAGDVSREELIVTTKLWNDDQGRARQAFDESRQRLGLEYLDIFLVHWPWPQKGLYTRAFADIARLRESGALRAAGVANFYPEVLDVILDATGVTPVLNQVELHAGFTQPELRDYHRQHGILTEAWAPLARGGNFDAPHIVAVAEKHQKTPAQVVLAYLMELGCSVIPKTANPQRLVENWGAGEVALSSEDIELLNSVEGNRMSGDPLTFPGDAD